MDERNEHKTETEQKREAAARTAPRPAPRPAPKRASKRSLRIAAAGSAAVAFVLPWVALRAAPHPPTGPQRIVVVQPSGSHVSGGSTSVTTTRASGAAVIH